MTDKKKADQQASLKKTPAHHNSASTEDLSKIARILAHLLTGASINRFEAERIGDHCLHTTISTLTNDYGLTFIRAWEQVPNRFGGKTRVKRYALPTFERDRAAKLLDLLMKRGRE